MPTLLIGLWMLALAAIGSGYSSSFAQLLLCRIVEGVGFGLMTAPPGILAMQWFSEKEWPYINMVNALCAYVGLTAVFTMTPPIYFALGASWRAVLCDYGIGFAVVALAWTLLGREKSSPQAAIGAHDGAGIWEVLKIRDVALIAVGLFGGMWVFQLYTAFLPQFFQSYRGFSLGEASNLTAVLPITGIVASAAGGIGTAVIGLRKPFTWPIALMTLAGCVGALILPSATGIRASLILVGVGSAGSLAAITTLLMELPGMTPAKMGTGLALVWSVGYAGAFVSPFLGGALAETMGLRNVMMAFLIFQLMPIACMYLLPETGPARKSVVVAAAA
jgi:MFS family permease